MKGAMILFPVLAFIVFVVLRLLFRGRTQTLLVISLVVGVLVELVLDLLIVTRR
jgi:hypothetical protein